MDKVEKAKRTLVEAVLRAYHTTRFKDVDIVDHVLSKDHVQNAFKDFYIAKDES